MISAGARHARGSGTGCRPGVSRVSRYGGSPPGCTVRSGPPPGTASACGAALRVRCRPTGSGRRGRCRGAARAAVRARRRARTAGRGRSGGRGPARGRMSPPGPDRGSDPVRACPSATSDRARPAHGRPAPSWRAVVPRHMARRGARWRRHCGVHRSPLHSRPGRGALPVERAIGRGRALLGVRCAVRVSDGRRFRFLRRAHGRTRRAVRGTSAARFPSLWALVHDHPTAETPF